MSLSDLQDHVAQALHWGLIDDDTILRVFLARRGHDVTRDIHQEFSRERRPNSDFPGESEQEAYQRALEALEKTIIFLRDSAGVPHFTFLAFRYLLIVLSRFFALYPNPSPRNIELLKRWYWRAALAGPSIARGSATGAVRTLASCIHLGDESGSVQNLLAAVRDKPTPVPDVSNFRSNYATGHIMLCALWHLAPRSPDTKKPFSYRDLAEQIGEESTPNVVCVPLFARSQVPLELRSSLGNRMILPGVPREAISPMLEDCLSDTGSLRGYADVAKSHRLDIDVISSDMGNRAGDVVGQREADLQVSISEFLMHMTGEGLDDSAPLDVFNFDDEDDDMHEVSEPESDEGFLW